MPVGFFVKIAAFIKRRWKFTVGVIIALTAIFIWNQHDSEWSRKMASVEKIHRAELDQVERARAKEVSDLKAIVLKLQSDLEESQALYVKQRLELERARRDSIDKIVHDDGNDPDELARRLAAAIGAKVKDKR